MSVDPYGPEELCLRKRKRKLRILPTQDRRKQLEAFLHSPVLRRPPQPSQEPHWKITIGQAAATVPAPWHRPGQAPASGTQFNTRVQAGRGHCGWLLDSRTLREVGSPRG